MQSSRVDTPELSWRVLRLLNLFRLLVPAVVWLLYLTAPHPRVVGAANQHLFIATTATYFVGALLSIVALRRRSRGAYLTAYLPVLLDIVAITLLTYASGGAESGLALLLLVPVGAISLLSSVRVALLTSAAATLALLAGQMAAWLRLGASGIGFAQAGYYGAILFLLSAAAAFLAGQLRETQAAVRQREVDLANLAELSEYIVQHLRESIVVIDSTDRIRLINESAREILGSDAAPGALLGEISPRLLLLTEQWRREPEGARHNRALFLAADASREIEAHFAPLGSVRPPPVIAFLEDTSRLAERVQQTKLAALGRLSASIAHEVRNPVGAMSHAAQLLSETGSLTPEDRRLTEIITDNAARISTIITNVQQLGRREITRPERIFLGEWIAAFVPEFLATLQMPAGRIVTALPEPDIEGRVDPSHLRQIVWNLCDNALRFSEEMPGVPPVEVKLGRIGSVGRPFLEVADRGPGIAPSASERIFEPFFTERKGGTGLGLFIARELAQCNGAVLLYEPRAGGGSIFRIVFSDPQRWEL